MSATTRQDDGERKGIVSFLGLDIPAADLETTLRVLRQFKGCESRKEWLDIPFVAWAKLEQLEEFLAHRVEGAELHDDTKRALDEYRRAQS